MYEKLVLVTRKTRLEELVVRFNTRPQAKFYIEHAGGDFAEYQREHDDYIRAVEEVRSHIDVGLPVQVIDRSLVPTFLFSDKDIVLVAGQDGLVANTAKYALGQPIIGLNVDPERYEGILVQVKPPAARSVVSSVMNQTAKVRHVTLAEASLNDGQRLLAFNDLFVGPRSHTSARYRLRYQGRSENQSSSGLIVSTGAGSTGWLSSVFHMAEGISRFAGAPAPKQISLDWSSAQLFFVVREPFVSKYSTAEIVAGFVDTSNELTLESRMATDGTIFSDGIESDSIRFNAGATVTIKPSSARAKIVLND